MVDHKLEQPAPAPTCCILLHCFTFNFFAKFFDVDHEDLQWFICVPIDWYFSNDFWSLLLHCHWQFNKSNWLLLSFWPFGKYHKINSAINDWMVSFFSQTQNVRTFVVIQSFATGLFGQLQNFWSGANTVLSLSCRVRRALYRFRRASGCGHVGGPLWIFRSPTIGSVKIVSSTF